MGDLDDRFEQLRGELAGDVHADDFDDVIRRRNKRFARRTGAIATTMAVVAAAVTWAAATTGSTATLHEVPGAPPLPSTSPSSNARADELKAAKLAAERARQLAAAREPLPTSFSTSGISFADATHGFVLGQRCNSYEDQG